MIPAERANNFWVFQFAIYTFLSIVRYGFFFFDLELV